MPAIDAAVARVLRVKFELGLFEHPYVDPDARGDERERRTSRNCARCRARSDRAAQERPRTLLPLKKICESVAVIGVDADEARLGGYSGPAATTFSILEGIRAASSARHARAIRARTRPVIAEYRRRSGRRARVERERTAMRSAWPASTSTTTRLEGAPRISAPTRAWISAGRSIRPARGFHSTGIRSAGRAHSLRRPAAPTHRRRGKRRLSPVSRRRAR